MHLLLEVKSRQHKDTKRCATAQDQMLQQIELVTSGFADLAWGPWLLVLLLGGGSFFSTNPDSRPFAIWDMGSICF